MLLERSQGYCRGVGVRVEAEKTHFRDRSLKASLSVPREVVSSRSEPRPHRDIVQHSYRMGNTNQGELGWVVALTNHILTQGGKQGS